MGPNGTSRELRHLRGARPHSGERSAGPDVKVDFAATNTPVFALDRMRGGAGRLHRTPSAPAIPGPANQATPRPRRRLVAFSVMSRSACAASWWRFPVSAARQDEAKTSSSIVASSSSSR